MHSHQINVQQDISQQAAKTLAQVLISAQGIDTPVLIKVASPSLEHTILVE
ncbi:hypothetical protein [Paenibacillus sp. DCT19]|uniref:hypothetical protein n=1 Tax=Paenibacillus sp. DCT19 TaxID=2211212 RepID=UPI0013E33EF3|nr:hypothetical protein [Paenibacillus sp. DCT19]